MTGEALLERKLEEVAASTYLRRLAIAVTTVGEGAAEVSLPYADQVSNRGGNVHGGAISSALIVAGSLAAASSHADNHEAVDGRPLASSISFLSAASGEDLVARGRTLRRGRDTVHVACDVHAAGAGRVATGSMTYRIAAEGDGAASSSVASTSLGEQERAELATATARRMSGSPYGQAAGIEVLVERPYFASARLPLAPNEGVDGRVHEGAVAGLVDNCGAFSSYAHPDAPTPGRGATVAMHLDHLGHVPGDVYAVSRVMARDGSAFTSQVEVASPIDGRISTLATVTYRIVAAAGAGS